METMEKVIPTLVPLVLEPLKTISKHASYPFKVSRNISSLESAIRELRALKRDVQTVITNGQRENMVPTEEINLWLAEVKTIEQKEAEIQRKHQQLCRCLWNISPNPSSNYKISRNAAEKQLEVKSLCDRRAAIKEVIMPMPPPLAQEMPVSSSKSPYLESALSDIKHDSHNIIGIWGMGGVGKTHLLKQVNNELSRDGAFNVVVFVTCSKECSAEKVQKEIIKKLGLTESDSLEIRQNTIHDFLKEKRFVLLLDDLWRRVDLQIVGIPTINEVVDSCKSKVILTTRSKNVCGLMMVDKLMKVDVLEKSAAWNLFKGQGNEETIESNQLVQKYAAEVVEELGRLPLALITIGRALSQTTDPREWKHAAELLKKARLHEVEHLETDETVFQQLKFSYDKLRNDNLRECFLHCSLWPEYYEIKKSALVELWMGLGLIEEDDIHLAYNVGYSYIRDLQAICLLEATNRESHVKLHDVIRDMSLWIVSNQGIEKNKWIVISNVLTNGSKEMVVIKEETEKISAICQWGRVSFLNTGCDAMLNTIMLMNCGRSPRHELRMFKHPAFSKLTVLNLKNNRLKNVPIEICDIVTLQFIDLSENAIDSLPSELEALTNLKFLLLRGNDIRTIPVGTISTMTALQVLDLTPGRIGPTSRREQHFPASSAPSNQHKLRIQTAELMNKLKGLPKFSAVGIQIDDTFQFSVEFWNVPIRWLTVSTIGCSRYYLSFFDYFLLTSKSKSNVVYLGITSMLLDKLIFKCASQNQSCELEVLEELDIIDISAIEIRWKGLEPKTVFPMLRCITISECENLASISWVVHLPCLQQLKISRCPGIRQMVIKSDVNEPTFPSLKLLEFSWLDELESICDPEIAFPALESLKIGFCRKLRKLPFRTHSIPPNLNTIMCVSKKWWDNIEWNDTNLEASLYGFVKFNPFL